MFLVDTLCLHKKRMYIKFVENIGIIKDNKMYRELIPGLLNTYSNIVGNLVR